MVQRRRRHTEIYENLSAKYLITENDIDNECFHRQYYHMYRSRVKLLKQRIIMNAKQVLGDDVKLYRLTKAKKDQTVFIVGTVTKRVKLRPSVLRDLAEEQLILPQPIAENKEGGDDIGPCREMPKASLCEDYLTLITKQLVNHKNSRLIGEGDYLEFEDDDQIVRLSGILDMDNFATGCVVGLYGQQLDDDIFQVDQVIWPCKAPQPSYPTFNDDRYVMFASGFSFGGQKEGEAEKLLSLEILQKWLSGLLPLSRKERSVVERLVRLVIAGENVAITDQGKEFTTAARYLIKNEECPNVECAAKMDKYLSKISSLLEVDVMPGLGDPSTHLMPQQPIHRAVFPKSSTHGKMLNLVTNPYHFSLGGVHIMGTSGESLSDLKRFAKKSINIGLLKLILDWQHLAPTVPDTIDGFPFVDRDPFIIETFPHILFAANQLEASYALAEFEDNRRTLLLSVPSFTKTHSVLVVNLRNLEVFEHDFSMDNLASESL